MFIDAKEARLRASMVNSLTFEQMNEIMKEITKQADSGQYSCLINVFALGAENKATLLKLGFGIRLINNRYYKITW